MPAWTREFWIKSIDQRLGGRVVCNRLEKNPENRHEHRGCEPRYGESHIPGEHGSPSRCVKYIKTEEDLKMCDFRKATTAGATAPATAAVDEWNDSVWMYETPKEAEKESAPEHFCFKVVDTMKECPIEFFNSRDLKAKQGRCWRPAKGHADYTSCGHGALLVEKEDRDGDGIERAYCAKPRRFSEDCPDKWSSGGPRWSSNHCGMGDKLNMGDVRCRMNWHGDDKLICQMMIEKYGIRMEECEKRGEHDQAWKEAHAKWHFKGADADKKKAEEAFWKAFHDEDPPHCYFYGQTGDDKAANCWKAGPEVEGSREFMTLKKSGWCSMPAQKTHVPAKHEPGYEKVDDKTGTKTWVEPKDIPAHDKPGCPAKFMGGEALFHLSKDGKECLWKADPAWRDATAGKTLTEAEMKAAEEAAIRAAEEAKKGGRL